MTRKDAMDDGSALAEAARWFVRVDVGESGDDAELSAWLLERPENERALQRVELAAVLGKRLAAEQGSALHAAAVEAARLLPRKRRVAPSLVWVGALAASLLVAIFIVRDAEPPAASAEAVTIEAARVVTFDAPRSSSAVLPSGAVVDASAVAVLPFAGSGDAALAEGLERDVVAALLTVPGLYVIAGDAVQPYAATDLAAAEIGSQLGARGIVDAAVELVDGRVLVSVRLRDSATGATLWRADVDKPVDELRAIRYEIVESVAATMLDSRLRERFVYADRSSATVSASKPISQ
jgi:TolB-like protein